MKRTLVRALRRGVAIVLCTILIFIIIKPSPPAHGSLRKELIRDIQEILSSKLKTFRLFPALFLMDISKLDLEGILEKDCIETQKSPSQEYERVPQHFRPRITEAERFLMLLTLQVFIKTMEEHRLTYFLYGGTLLGAFRHRGFIPWDDDIDVMVRSREKERVCQVLSNVPGYQVFCPKDLQSKFFRKGRKSLRWSDYTWPYVNIFYFSDDSDYVVDDLTGSTLGHKYSDIFPLQYHSFEGATLPVPQRIAFLLEDKLRGYECQSHYMCHKTEAPMQEFPSVPCSQLSEFYNFVWRLELDSVGIHETKGGKTDNI